MSQSTEKSLGQVLYEAEFAPRFYIPFADIEEPDKTFYERMAQAVAAVVREQCAQVCEGRAGMRGTGAWTALTAAADAIRSIKP